MTASLRFFFTCTLLAAPLAACGDDKGTSSTTESSATQGTGTDGTTTDGTTTDGTTDGTTTDTPTTDAPTTDGTTTTPGTTTTGPGTTTDATTGPGTTTDDTTDTGVGPSLSWEVDVYPVVIGNNCGCHNLGSGGLTMNDATDSHANLVDVDSSEAPGFKRVAPGDPANSYMLAKVKGVAGDPPFMGNPSQMPLGGPPLTPDTIALLEDWIADGAMP